MVIIHAMHWTRLICVLSSCCGDFWVGFCYCENKRLLRGTKSMLNKSETSKFIDNYLRKQNSMKKSQQKSFWLFQGLLLNHPIISISCSGWCERPKLLPYRLNNILTWQLHMFLPYYSIIKIECWLHQSNISKAYLVISRNQSSFNSTLNFLLVDFIVPHESGFA